MRFNTIGEAIEGVYALFEASDLYYGHGTDNPWDEAVYLVFAALGLPPESTDEVLPRPLTPEESDRLFELAQSRVRTRKPLAYLLNTAYFAGLPFYVDERVIVPRSPFAELILTEFQPWLGSCTPERILEIGTGSGCMAITCAKVFPGAQVDAADISKEALSVAALNVKAHHVAHQVRLLESDVMEKAEGLYDLIISNPPYVDAEDFREMPTEYHHEPKIALASGEEGLDCTIRILESALNHLKPNGMLFVEVGNSAVALENKYPKLPFIWIELTEGGHGIFCLSAQDLKRHVNS
ncbi:MAG: 50S ribosomal protein L3 N(5)-glutamine methyltransferase [Gammaproteobacteria bacterium]|nr:50S ribosomal protein L3 N(5)-glutamine methyltransferase [Gammaproteobacteria bacterium]